MARPVDAGEEWVEQHPAGGEDEGEEDVFVGPMGAGEELCEQPAGGGEEWVEQHPAGGEDEGEEDVFVGPMGAGEELCEQPAGGGDREEADVVTRPVDAGNE